MINMRWAPNAKAKLIHSYAAGEMLTVLAELKNWYQVQDPENGWVGFIRSDFLMR
jgi:SH3-like domain-containing protein